ncbi:hypothetical protein CPB86DRAFT_800601 [Serendipita vermifera]|nr:hypothetical protein CPB86DRAFT_800601 [Serendipita vermifera]
MQTTESKPQRVQFLCNEARGRSLRYTNGPAPPDLFERQRWKMANLHLLLIDSIQGIYDQVDTITEAQQEAFISYSYLCEQALHQYRWLQENVIFPMLSHEFQDHALKGQTSFSEPMERWEGYLESLLALEKTQGGEALPSKTGHKAVYDGNRMKRCIEDLSEPLFVHMKNEIGWLVPQKIRASGLPLGKLKRLKELEADHFCNDVDRFSFGYWLVAHLRPGSQFPEMPWVVKEVLLPWIFYWKYRSAWQFAPKHSYVGKTE